MEQGMHQRLVVSEQSELPPLQKEPEITNSREGSQVFSVKGGVVELRGRVVGLRGGVVGLHSRVVGLRGGVVGLRSGVVGLRHEVVGLHGGVVGLCGRVVGQWSILTPRRRIS